MVNLISYIKIPSYKCYIWIKINITLCNYRYFDRSRSSFYQFNVISGSFSTLYFTGSFVSVILIKSIVEV